MKEIIFESHRKDFEFINHHWIIISHLWEDGVHLLKKSKTILEKLDIDFLKNVQINRQCSMVDFNISDEKGSSHKFNHSTKLNQTNKLDILPNSVGGHSIIAFALRRGEVFRSCLRLKINYACLEQSI